MDTNRLHVEEARDLLSVIVTALACRPVDEEKLRRGVWNLVSLERQEGTSPGEVILTLTDIVAAAHIQPMKDQQVLMRRVIVWCVEAYFGQLGGDAPADYDPDLASTILKVPSAAAP